MTHYGRKYPKYGLKARKQPIILYIEESFINLKDFNWPFNSKIHKIRS